jgi:hypothetical protein
VDLAMSYDCVCDYDSPDFYHRSMRTARKAHRCEECAEEIRPGDRYEYVAGKWNGDLDTFKTCERCADLTTWVKNNVPCLCWGHGNRLNDLDCAVEEAAMRAPEETVGLRFGFLRRKVQRDKFYAARRTS